MKITVYTTKDCAFSKQEKEYLNTNKLVFEEKDLETNKDFLTEMLAISNNFAGTPVTRVEKDDGTIAVLKGFTKEEFDTTFGLTPTPVPTDVASPESQAKAGSTAPPQVNDTPITPPPVVEPPVETPAVTTPDPLKSVMDDLQAKVDSTMPPAIEPVQPPVETIPPVVEQPAVVPPADAPAIPDFPADTSAQPVK